MRDIDACVCVCLISFSALDKENGEGVSEKLNFMLKTKWWEKADLQEICGRLIQTEGVAKTKTRDMVRAEEINLECLKRRKKSVWLEHSDWQADMRSK